MSVVQVKTVEEFDQLQKKVGVLVSHFHAEWAPQCKQINDVLAELALQPDTKGVVFAAVPAEDVPEVSQRLGVTAVPTVVVTWTTAEGAASTVAGRVDGARPGDVTELVQRIATKAFLTGTGVTAPPAPQETKEDLNNRIKKIIHSAPCMLFMKGSTDSPKCGFSRTTVELLNQQNAQYSTFDILTDEAVRQGLKIYSDFPTYPQLYVKGELIGGLDIMKEMDAAGELADMLPKKALLEDRLKALINQAPLMVFMKGDRDGPRCGFSRTLMEILKESELPFETFDILSDEEVRQGLKTFSNWPTYPQVYVKGELIGGLDIIKEMKSDGSLLEALKGN